MSFKKIKTITFLLLLCLKSLLAMEGQEIYVHSDGRVFFVKNDGNRKRCTYIRHLNRDETGFCRVELVSASQARAKKEAIQKEFEREHSNLNQVDQFIFSGSGGGTKSASRPSQSHATRSYPETTKSVGYNGVDSECSRDAAKIIQTSRQNATARQSRQRDTHNFVRTTNQTSHGNHVRTSRRMPIMNSNDEIYAYVMDPILKKHGVKLPQDPVGRLNGFLDLEETYRKNTSFQKEINELLQKDSEPFEVQTFDSMKELHKAAKDCSDYTSDIDKRYCNYVSQRVDKSLCENIKKESATNSTVKKGLDHLAKQKAGALQKGMAAVIGAPLFKAEMDLVEKITNKAQCSVTRVYLNEKEKLYGKEYVKDNCERLTAEIKQDVLYETNVKALTSLDLRFNSDSPNLAKGISPSDVSPEAADKSFFAFKETVKNNDTTKQAKPLIITSDFSIQDKFVRQIPQNVPSNILRREERYAGLKEKLSSCDLEHTRNVLRDRIELRKNRVELEGNGKVFNQKSADTLAKESSTFGGSTTATTGSSQQSNARADGGRVRRGDTVPMKKVRGSSRDGAQPNTQSAQVSDARGLDNINQRKRDISLEHSNVVHVEAKREPTLGEKFSEATAKAGKTFVASFASSFASSVAAAAVDSYFNSGSRNSSYAPSRAIGFDSSSPSYRTRDPHAPRGYSNPNMIPTYEVSTASAESLHILETFPDGVSTSDPVSMHCIDTIPNHISTSDPVSMHCLDRMPDGISTSDPVSMHCLPQNSLPPELRDKPKPKYTSQSQPEPQQPKTTTPDQDTEDEPFFDLFADNPEANMLREQISNAFDFDTRPDSNDIPLMDAIPSEEEVAYLIEQTADSLNDFQQTTQAGIEDFSGNAQHAQECLDLVKTTTADFLALATQAQERGDAEAAGILSDFSSNFLQLGKNLVDMLKTPAEKLGNSSRWLHQELKNNPQKVFLYFGLRIARGVDFSRCIQGGGIPLDFLEGQDVLGDYDSLSTADLGMAIIQRMVIGGTFKGLGRIAKLAGKAKAGDFSKGVKKLGSEKGFGKGGGAAAKSWSGGATKGKASASGAASEKGVKSGIKAKKESLLTRWFKRATPIDEDTASFQRSVKLDDGMEAVFRRDVGSRAHPIEKLGYKKDVDHYNVDIKMPFKNKNPVVHKCYIVVDKDKNVIKYSSKPTPHMKKVENKGKPI